MYRMITEVKMGCSHTHLLQLRIERDILAAEVSPEEHVGSIPTLCSPARSSSAGRASGNPDILLKSPHTDSLAHKIFTIRFSKRTVAQKMPGAYEEKLNCMATG